MFNNVNAEQKQQKKDKNRMKKKRKKQQQSRQKAEEKLAQDVRYAVSRLELLDVEEMMAYLKSEGEKLTSSTNPETTSDNSVEDIDSSKNSKTMMAELDEESSIELKLLLEKYKNKQNVLYLSAKLNR